jgi:hypothetical protein
MLENEEGVKRALHRIAGIMFLVSTVLMLGSWMGLMSSFEYPDILRKAPGYVLESFYDGGSGLILLWTGMSVSTFLLGLCILLFYVSFAKEGGLSWRIGTGFGLLSCLVQVLGLIRWVLVVPALASLWQGTAVPSERFALETAFTVVNQYGGVAIGETLGFLLSGIWIVFVGIMILKSRVFHRVAGFLAIASGAGVAIGILEQAGVTWAPAVNAWSYMLMFALFIYFGIMLLIRKKA